MSTHESNRLLVNVGCGRTFHRDWLNLDLMSCDPEVRACDLRKGIPLPDGSCAAVYSSHVLEHLSRSDGAGMLRECRRVLMPGGVIRIVVPDLEKIARDYLACVEKGLAGDEFVHRWLTIELYDQATRTHSGGEMGVVIREADAARMDFIERRLGEESTRVRSPNFRRGRREVGATVKEALRRAHRSFLQALVLAFGGRGNRDALQEGWFRNSGEIHLTMYDRVSLARALIAAGFVGPRVCLAAESSIPNFPSFSLDAANGVPRKPDSLFMEAFNP